MSQTLTAPVAREITNHLYGMSYDIPEMLAMNDIAVTEGNEAKMLDAILNAGLDKCAGCAEWRDDGELRTVDGDLMCEDCRE